MSNMIKSGIVIKANIGSMRFGTANTRFGSRPVVNMSVAEHNGEKTTWYRTAFFGEDAKKLQSIYKVGDFITLEGDLSEETSEYQGKTYTNMVIRPTSIKHVGVSSRVGD